MRLAPFSVTFAPNRQQCSYRLMVIGCTTLLTAVVNCTERPDVVARERNDVTDAGAGESTPTGDADNPQHAAADSGAPNPVQALELSGDLETHDSSIIEAAGSYYLFHSGEGIQMKTSDDLTTWRAAGRVFSENPEWVAELVPDAMSLWAPDIAYVDGRYHLYYAASTFGSGRSCIGHASTASFDVSPIWEDHGPVICSDLDGADDDWDAIDPSQLTDVQGRRWLGFGSFGSGIKLIPLDDQGDRDGDELLAIAQRPEEPHAIQAPFLMHRESHYYLFVSFDWCCRGVSSTNNIRVGRSSDLLGPYLDKDGVPMMEGGGTLVLEGNERWRGAGANSLLTTRGQDYVVYHSYDSDAAGRATLRIAEVAWDTEGWPIFGGP